MPGHLTLQQKCHAYAQALEALSPALEESLQKVVAHLQNSTGRVAFCGAGKSGYVSQKLTSTFASYGQPAFFLNPTEAAHGELGALSPNDTLFVLSASGRTPELTPILHYAHARKITIVAITCEAASPVAQAAAHLLLLPRSPEICPLGLAPTTSSLLMMAAGDILATELANQHGLTRQDYGRMHPAGQLGHDLLPVSTIMRTGAALPVVSATDMMPSVLLTMTQKKAGCALVTDTSGALLGIITDGDLRRTMQNNLLGRRAQDIMTSKPMTITPQSLASEAIARMNTQQVGHLCVVSQQGELKGLVHWHDCFAGSSEITPSIPNNTPVAPNSLLEAS